MTAPDATSKRCPFCIAAESGPKGVGEFVRRRFLYLCSRPLPAEMTDRIKKIQASDTPSRPRTRKEKAAVTALVEVLFPKAAFGLPYTQLGEVLSRKKARRKGKGQSASSKWRSQKNYNHAKRPRDDYDLVWGEGAFRRALLHLTGELWDPCSRHASQFATQFLGEKQAQDAENVRTKTGSRKKRPLNFAETSDAGRVRKGKRKREAPVQGSRPSSEDIAEVWEELSDTKMEEAVRQIPPSARKRLLRAIKKVEKKGNA